MSTHQSAQSNQTASATQFLQIPVWKFVLLTVLSFGLYSIYWNWYNWNQVRLSQNRKIWPVVRAIFSIFFIIQLFREIARSTKSGTKAVQSATFYGILYILLPLVLAIIGFAYQPPNTSPENYNPHFDLFISFASIALMVAVMSPIQDMIVRAKNQVTPRKELSGGEIAFLAVGLMLLTLTLLTYVLQAFLPTL